MPSKAITFITILVVGVCSGLNENSMDNKATESETTGSMMDPPMMDESKVTEKRAPIHMTAVLGQQQQQQQPYPYKYSLESKPSQLLVKNAPSYQYYYPQNNHLQMISPMSPMLIFMAAQHPSGYMMLIPATIYPQQMFNYMYLPQPTTSPLYNKLFSSPSGPASATVATLTGKAQVSHTGHNHHLGQLTANAGFAAQQQLIYSGPTPSISYEQPPSASDSLLTAAGGQSKAAHDSFTNRLRGIEPYVKG